MPRQDWWPGKSRGRARGARFQPASSGDVRTDILFWMARSFWVDSWIAAEEEAHRSHAGEDLLDAAPPTPPEAFQKAEEYAGEVERANRKDLVELYFDTLNRSNRNEGEEARRDFGLYLVMQGIGHGVGLWDEFGEHEVTVPLTEWMY